MYPYRIKSTNVPDFCHNVRFMNFLAHLLLSGKNEKVIMGNYVGDFIKGRLTDQKTASWNKDYVLGLKLHRFIDSFTDSHPIVRETKNVIAQEHGKIAGIVLDIYFDYILAKYFDQFCDVPLDIYAQQQYSVFGRNAELVPPDATGMVQAMIRQDWLTTYATLEGIDLTFSRLSRRAPFLLSLTNAVEELKIREAFYRQQFLKFFPQLQIAADSFLNDESVVHKWQGY